ncbi:MAG TPA: S41 family peptidase [Stellaceae bacterium]|nr:S41 family peptidase [Stellaceae bacterium]
MMNPSRFGLALILMLAGCTMQPPPVSSNNSEDLSLYRSVIERVRESYVEPVSDDKLVVNSLKGMLQSLDPHSDFMDEREYQEMISDGHGEFAGIGAELSREDNHPKVISPIDDTPAARAGIRAGDIITRIDGQPTDGLSLKDAVDRLRGPEGTIVALTIAREGQRPFDVSLTRAVIKIVSVKSHLEAGHIGYARITTFAERTQGELVTAINRMTREAGGGQLSGFVLDLRNDPGGLLKSSIDVAGDFLDGGTVVSTKGRDIDDDKLFVASSNGDRLHGAPMVVLINGASASASEIVAGALQDHHRATLIGTRSFGKGSVQTIIPFDGHGALRLTTARYYTPSGRSIQGEGITPDMVVLPAKDQQSAQIQVLHEANLRGALKNPTLSASAGQPAGNEPSLEASIDPAIIGTSKDSQLLAAVKFLSSR